MTKNNEAYANTIMEKNVANIRLPCRGCPMECTNYNICDGKPWRLNDTLQKTKHEPIKERH